jgi:UDP-N-acetylmuramoyl-tripeptide--D-alanyl-D-alanine ligase
MIIDDTYNASPVSMLAALNLLEDIANGESRPIAVLGEMLELGAYEEEGHSVVGGRAAQIVAKLITVGPLAQTIAEAAIASGKSTKDVYPVADNEEAIATLQRLICSGDVVLVKGSRGAGMERIVDALSLPRSLIRKTEG